MVGLGYTGAAGTSGGIWTAGATVEGSTAVASLILPFAFEDATRYLVLVSGLKATTNGAVLQSRVQISTGVVSGAGTHAYVTVADASTGAAGTNQSNSTSVMNLAYALETSHGVEGAIEVIDGHDTAKRTKVVSGLVGPSSGAAVSHRRASGIYLATTEVTGLQLFMSSGNIAGGYKFELFYR